MSHEPNHRHAHVNNESLAGHTTNSLGKACEVKVQLSMLRHCKHEHAGDRKVLSPEREGGGGEGRGDSRSVEEAQT